MSTDASGPGTPVATVVRSGDLSLSKWVNEPLPPWNEILSRHEVARLTRRHRWVLSALTWVGRFPKRQRFRGRWIGWRRADVVDWLAKDLHASSRRAARPHGTCSTLRLQKCLALECTAPCTPMRTPAVRTKPRKRVLPKTETFSNASNGVRSNA